MLQTVRVEKVDEKMELFSLIELWCLNCLKNIFFATLW